MGRYFTILILIADLLYYPSNALHKLSLIDYVERNQVDFDLEDEESENNSADPTFEGLENAVAGLVKHKADKWDPIIS